MEPSVLGEAVEAFEGASQKQRSQFIDALFASLRPSEKHALQEKLLQDCYFFDILGSLPVEISLQIAGLLSPRDIILLRQVSSRWMVILSSKQPAQNIVQTYYSNRSDFLSYAHQIKQNPFSALLNLAFREYAGQTNLFKLRTILNFSSKTVDQDRFFRFLRCSADLRYVVFEHLIRPTPQWYLIDIDNGPTQQVIPLANKNREALNSELSHVGSHCIAGVTLGSSRVLVWNMKGKPIRDFKLIHEGHISLASSEKYLCIRNENTNSIYTDYYLLNITTGALHVFERVQEFIKNAALARERNVFAAPAMKILDHSNQIVLVADVAARCQVAVSWMTFNEEKRSLVEKVGNYTDYKLPVGMPNIPRRVIFQRGANTSILSIFNGKVREIYLEAVILSDTQLSVTLRDFDPNFCEVVPKDPSYVIRKSFRYRNTVYAVICSAPGRVLPETEHLIKHSLWCSRGDQVTPLGKGHILELPSMGGRLQTIGVSDMGFLLFFDGGLLFYEWLDFDEFMELQKHKNESELQELSVDLQRTRLKSIPGFTGGRFSEMVV